MALAEHLDVSLAVLSLSLLVAVFSLVTPCSEIWRSDDCRSASWLSKGEKSGLRKLVGWLKTSLFILFANVEEPVHFWYFLRIFLKAILCVLLNLDNDWISSPTSSVASTSLWNLRLCQTGPWDARLWSNWPPNCFNCLVRRSSRRSDSPYLLFVNKLTLSCWSTRRMNNSSSSLFHLVSSSPDPGMETGDAVLSVVLSLIKFFTSS